MPPIRERPPLTYTASVTNGRLASSVMLPHASLMEHNTSHNWQPLLGSIKTRAYRQVITICDGVRRIEKTLLLPSNK